jgi:UDP-glucose 4-epimerase
MRVLITGGAGYIGSHTVVQLAARGHDPVVLDNFSNSKRSVLERVGVITGRTIELRELDLRDEPSLARMFDADVPYDAVIHFAGLKSVGESVSSPLDYYDNNVSGTVHLLRVMQAHDVRTIVFSSSATVYGADGQPPLSEGLPTAAVNPYGWTKVHIEQILNDVAATDSGWRIAALRYFNPVGAHRSGLIGEDPNGIPNNLMPYVAKVAAGVLPRLRVFGNDYDTPDGTGVRDYIHVEDLASGHLSALQRINANAPGMGTWNLGTGKGTSVLELVETFQRVTGRPVPYDIVARRPGDAAVSFADPTLANRELGWRAVRTVEDMCVDTWRWQACSREQR